MASPVLLSMDANQNRTGQKTGKLTSYTRNGGEFLCLLSCRYKKVGRPSGTKKHNLIGIMFLNTIMHHNIHPFGGDQSFLLHVFKYASDGFSFTADDAGYFLS